MTASKSANSPPKDLILMACEGPNWAGSLIRPASESEKSSFYAESPVMMASPPDEDGPLKSR